MRLLVMNLTSPAGIDGMPEAKEASIPYYVQQFANNFFTAVVCHLTGGPAQHRT